MKLFIKFASKFIGTDRSKVHITRIILSLVAASAVLLPATELQAAPLTIFPNGSANLVTAGIPFAPCAMPDVSKFKLISETGAEVPVFIKPTLLWPASKCAGVSTVRAVKIQFAYNPAQGPKVYNWQNANRMLPDRIEAAVAEVATANPLKAPYKEPAFYAINDPAYLVTAEIIPPSAIAGTANYDKLWYPALFGKRVARTDFSTTAAVDWIFDSVSAIYQQALRSGNVEYYREAYLEHEFWITHMKVADAGVKKDFCIGGFNLSGEAMPYSEGGNECDPKYVYLNPMKLHLALTGDDSWTPREGAATPNPLAADKTTLVKTIAARAFTSDWSRTAGIIAPYTNIAAGFTERNSGFSLQQQVSAYELTLDPLILKNLLTTIDNLYAMMVNNPDGLGNHGYLSHSWDKHEGDVPVYIGMSPTFSGGETDTQTTSKMVVSKLLGEDYKKIAVGATIFFKPFGPYTAILSKAPDLNADGTITLTFTSPVAVRSNQWVTLTANGSGVPRTSFVADRVFSTWMQSIVADGLWQFYQITDDATVKAKISEMLLGFGRAVTAYSIDGTGLKSTTKQLIESAFGVKVVSSGVSGSRGGIYPRYAANHLMNGAPPEYIDYMNYDGGFADQHTAEALFQVALAIRFETDPAKKAAMLAVAKDFEWYFDDAIRAVGTGDGYPTRYFNWTTKPNAWGTYGSVTGNNTQPDSPSIPITPVSPLPSPAAVISYDKKVFAESTTKNGTTTTVLTLTLANASFANAEFSAPTYYTVTNLPAGMTPVLTKITNNTLTLKLNGTATANDNINDVNNIRVKFTNAAFTLDNASAVIGADVSDIATDFNDSVAKSNNSKQTKSSGAQISNLVIAEDEVMTSTAILSDPVVYGTVIGGSLSGDVESTDGTIQDVNLVKGTVINGGSVKGRITGSGTITNAIVDATELGADVKLSSGTKITSRTLGKIQGKDLSGLFIDEKGNLDFSSPLLIDNDSNELSLLDLVTTSLNRHFDNNTTLVKENNANGLISFINSDLDDSYVFMRPTSVIAANSPDAIETNHRGDLVIVASGIKTTFASSPQDLQAFRNGVSAIKATDAYYGNGLIEVDYSGAKYAFRVSQQSLNESANNGGKTASAVVEPGAKVSFKIDGSIANPETYRINTVYSDGSAQELVPYVHDIEGFEAWILGAGFTYSMDAAEGFVSIYNTKNQQVWRGIPGYNITPNKTPQLFTQILKGGDVNKDGYEDFTFKTPYGTQVMFGLPIK